MTDGRFGTGRTDDEGRMPWLEPVEEETVSSGPPIGRIIGLLILGLFILGAVAGGYSWWSQQGATEGHGELIPALPGPYKTKPADPGGMTIDGEGDTAFAASEGADPRGRIDMSAVPEDPVVAGAPKAKPKTQDPEAEPEAEAKAPAGAGGSIQLGAFSSEAAAASAWKVLAGRFRYLEPLAYTVVPVKTGDRTLYRLRASGPDAAGICGRLRIAGESCVSVN